MKYKYLFSVAAIVAALTLAGADALAQAGAAVAAATTTAASGSTSCSIQANPPGTYASPVEVVVGDNADVVRYAVGFDVADDGVDFWETHTPSDRARAAFRVSRSYESIRLIGFNKDGGVECEDDDEYVIASPAPAARRPARKAASKAASPAAHADWAIPMCEAIRLGMITVEQGGESRRVSLAQRRVDDSTMVCSGNDADGDGLGDLCETTTSTGWTPLADARDVVQGDNRAVERAVDRARGEAAALVEDHDARRHRGPGAGTQRVGAWTGIGTLGGALVCGLASIGSGGLAAGVCIPALAIGGAVGATAGVADALTQ